MISLERRVMTPREMRVPKKEGDIFVAALTSPHFKDRVTYGMKRVRELDAESGFSVIAKKRHLIYSAVDLGGSHPRDELDIRIGNKAQTYVGEESLEDYFFSREELLEEIDHFSHLGILHFHPTRSRWGGFSNQDMLFYEEAVDHPSTFPARLDHAAMLVETRKLNEKIDSKILLIQGPPTSTRYQAIEMDTVRSLDRQQEIFDESGFKTIIADVPFEDGVADLSQFGEALNVMRNGE